MNKYKIKPKSINNMDEKGYAMGMIRKTCVIIIKHKQIAYIM